jgi:hypothetical protein
MTPILLAFAMLAQPQCNAPRPYVIKLAEMIREVEDKHELPAGILAAVCLAETGCRPMIVVEKKGGCSVGPWQIYDPKCSLAHLKKFINLRAGAVRAAQILVFSRNRCKRRNCPSEWVYFNLLSKTWWMRVEYIHYKLRTSWAHRRDPVGRNGKSYAGRYARP